MTELTGERTRAQPSRRNPELAFLIGAWILGILGTLQVGWATGEGTPPRLWVTVGVVGVITLGMHLVVRRRARYADPILLPVATLLTILGLVMIYRIDVAAAQRAVRNETPAPTPDVYAQLTWFAIAAVFFAAVLILIKDHRRLQRYTYSFGLAGLVLLVLPMAPFIGTTVNGANITPLKRALSLKSKSFNNANAAGSAIPSATVRSPRGEATS